VAPTIGATPCGQRTTRSQSTSRQHNTSEASLVQGVWQVGVWHCWPDDAAARYRPLQRCRRAWNLISPAHRRHVIDGQPLRRGGRGRRRRSDRNRFGEAIFEGAAHRCRRMRFETIPGLPPTGSVRRVPGHFDAQQVSAHVIGDLSVASKSRKPTLTRGGGLSTVCCSRAKLDGCAGQSRAARHGKCTMSQSRARARANEGKRGPHRQHRVVICAAIRSPKRDSWRSRSRQPRRRDWLPDFSVDAAKCAAILAQQLLRRGQWSHAFGLRLYLRRVVEGAAAVRRLLS